ncbi:nuclear transport factor 2 isoform X1 [Ricinus communis]|uniref:nuclear transport factor 2 isoform X1 n=1 Tax=Ricinus communis TaxID=3988 RepID=UPI000772B401|nr:nuclear transport factor 2 isoform X1 [Ricinus communis]|eukprot:XP_015579926.1 ras GTPase-activating protein-binding protein 1 isoform X1 [Ricinus communis]
MALQPASSPATPSAQVVGNAFVEQYYHILHTSPELVFRFYQDTSVISRPDADGVMTSVATMQGINEKILSLNFQDYKAEIKTADAQKSYKEGVTVLVTGCLMGKDNLKRKFAQSFFLAPQDNGYFVLNDVFRYVEDNEPLESHPVNGSNNTPTVPSIPDSEPSHVPDPSAPDPAILAMDQDNVAEKASDPVNSEKEIVYEKEVVVESQSHSNGTDVSIVVESPSSAAQEDIPKKSYASIVKVARGSSGPTKVYVPTRTVKVSPKKPETHSVPIAPVTEPEASMPSGNETPESSNAEKEVEGHSVYVRNLPYNMTTAQLEVEFEKFGPIKQEGVQVRYNKQQGYCFGFVEFLSLSSMNSAIQASPMIIGGRQAVIEIKRTSTRVAVGSGRGRFPSGRAGFRSDSFRGRGNYGGGRGLTRNEYGDWSEFSGRGRSSGGRGWRGEGYQQGRGRGGRLSGAKQNTNLA